MCSVTNFLVLCNCEHSYELIAALYIGFNALEYYIYSIIVSIRVFYPPVVIHIGPWQPVPDTQEGGASLLVGLPW